LVTNNKPSLISTQRRLFYFDPATALFATSAKQTQSLNAAAQFAPILDEVIAPIIRIDLLEFHCSVTDNTIHQI
jgi:hypothetical protein